MDFAKIHQAELEPQRAQIRALCVQGLYAQATELARTASDEVLIFTPCEALADHLRAQQPAEAARLYAIAAQMWEYEGTQATGSGEGLMAMHHLKIVEEKLLSCISNAVDHSKCPDAGRDFKIR